MTSGRRGIWILTMAVFLVVTSGCARTSLRSVEDEIARGGTGLHKERGQSVRGYLLDDDTMVEYKGQVRLTEQDSLTFWSEGYSEEVSHQGVKKKIKIPGPVLALSVVKALDVMEARTGRSILLGLAVVFVGLTIAVLASGPSNFE